MKYITAMLNDDIYIKKNRCRTRKIASQNNIKKGEKEKNKRILSLLFKEREKGDVAKEKHTCLIVF